MIPTQVTSKESTESKTYRTLTSWSKLPYPYTINSVRNNFASLKESVLVKRPVLREIYSEYGNLSPLDYEKVFIEHTLGNLYKSRRPELMSVIKEVLTPRLGEGVTVEVISQLEKTNFVSTADHHGPVLDPYFINSNLTTALAGQNFSDPLKYLVVFSCANVSLNNSTFPRGLSFTSETSYGMRRIKLPFFEASSRLSPVINFRPYVQKDIDRLKKEFRKLSTSGMIKKNVEENFLDIFSRIYDNDYIKSLSSFSEQVTATNLLLWDEIFKSDSQKQKLVYIEQEKIVSELIRKIHLNKDTLISDILFDQKSRQVFREVYEGVEGGFSEANKAGSFLFWALPKGSKYRIQLWLKDNTLANEDGSIVYELSRTSLETALQEGELIPSMLLTFVVLSFYYGLNCLGGFCQVNYLTNMKERFSEYLQLVGTNFDNHLGVETKRLCEGMSIAFLQNSKGKSSLATGLDLLLYGTPNFKERLTKTAKTITVSKALDVMLPEFYTVMYGELERSPQLLNLTASDIADQNGLNELVWPCAVL